MQAITKNTEKILYQISQALLAREESLGVGESVTAGGLQTSFSLATRATEFFQGGLTAYNTGQKARHLGVDPISAERANCVSERVANEMAVGVCSLFSCDWGLAVTGYAAPVPEWNVKTRLFAWYALAYRSSIVHTEKLEIKKMEMIKVQQYYVREILKHFSEFITDFVPPR